VYLTHLEQNYFTGFLFYLANLWLLTAQWVAMFWPLCGLGSFEIPIHACPGHCSDVLLLLEQNWCVCLPGREICCGMAHGNTCIPVTSPGCLVGFGALAAVSAALQKPV